MKYLVFSFIIFFMVRVHAVEKPDEWLCTSQGISRSANVFEACGTGEGTTEGRARMKALEAAMDEFTIICKASADCDIKNVSVLPKRMSCNKQEGEWKCYRLIVITLGRP